MNQPAGADGASPQADRPPNSESLVRDIEITKDMVERRDLSLCLLEKAG